MQIPNRRPDFSFNSSNAVVEIFHNRVFVLPRSEYSGEVERREFMIVQVQGMQFNQVFSQTTDTPRPVYEVFYDGFSGYTFNDTSKEIRVSAIVSTGGTIEMGLILDPAGLADGISMKFSSYVANINYTGINRASVNSVTFPISLFAKVPHTSPDTTIQCRQSQTTIGSNDLEANCISKLVNMSASTGIVARADGSAQYSIIFEQKSEILNISQTWPITVEVNGASTFPDFTRFSTVISPYGLESYYKVRLGSYFSLCCSLPYSRIDTVSVQSTWSISAVSSRLASVRTSFLHAHPGSL